MAPNVRVGKYILKKKIGEGAFAEVRHAVHEETKEEYAVKVFDRANLPEGDFEKDIKKEVRIMQHLRHPNIVSIHAVLVTTSKMYLVMEYVRGGELYDEIVSRRRIDEDTSRKYFQQLIDAMCYCHRRGVVHRDLKPENLLLDEKGNLKVTDFGMSWISDKATTEEKQKHLLRTQCGTPKYMAPEIIVRPSKGYDGEKLDAWECGMVLYALLAGYLPFAGDDDDAVFRSILKGTVKFPSFFSSGARSLLLKLLEKNPDKRASLDEVRQHPWFLVNYFGDAAPAPAPEASETGSAGRMSGDSQEHAYLDARGDSKLDVVSMAPSPPPAPIVSPADRRTTTAANRNDVLRLNLNDLEEDDPFKSGLQEEEVPATPTPRLLASVDVTNGAAPVAQKTPEGKTTPVTPLITSPTTPSPASASGARPASAEDDSGGAFRQLGSMFSPKLSTVFAMSSRIGSFASPPPASAHGDAPRGAAGGGPTSIRERISGSPLVAMYRNLRDGLSPHPKNGGESSSSGTWAQDESPSSVTNPSATGPLTPPRASKNANDVPKVAKRKLKKGFKHST